MNFFKKIFQTLDDESSDSHSSDTPQKNMPPKNNSEKKENGEQGFDLNHTVDSLTQKAENIKANIKETIKESIKEKLSPEKENGEKNTFKDAVNFLAGKESEQAQKPAYLSGFWEYAGKIWDDSDIEQDKGMAHKVASIWQSYQEAKSHENSSRNTYERISESSTLDSNFVILLAGSTLVATFGLLQNSTAVIIGAMIIAPLMMPILGFSLATIWGDFRLFFRSLFTLFVGSLFAVMLSAFISYIIPGNEYNTEIFARTGPNLFDVFIALASGFVGAYAYVSPMISPSISGVAIAVALMPPLCTVGITLGNGDFDLSLGATLLFLINIVGIALAASFVFWRKNIHPATDTKKEVKSRAIKQIAFSSIFLIALSIPVTWFMVESFRNKQEYANAVNFLSTAIPGVEINSCSLQKDSPKPNPEKEDVADNKNTQTFKCTLVIPSSVSQEQIKKAKEAVMSFFHRETNIYFVTLAVFDSSSEIKRVVSDIVKNNFNGEIIGYDFSDGANKRILELTVLTEVYPQNEIIEKVTQEILALMGKSGHLSLKILQKSHEQILPPQDTAPLPKTAP